MEIIDLSQPNEKLAYMLQHEDATTLLCQLQAIRESGKTSWSRAIGELFANKGLTLPEPEVTYTISLGKLIGRGYGRYRTFSVTSSEGISYNGEVTRYKDYYYVWVNGSLEGEMVLQPNGMTWEDAVAHGIDQFRNRPDWQK